MTRGIGYYVHHQGAGHRERACRIAQALARPCTLIGTFGAAAASCPARVLDLPDDRLAGGFEGRDAARTRPAGLHYAPLGHAGVRARMAAIAGWVAREAPALMVVDVSVEVALLARLLSLPTVYVRLAGTRTDPPHLEAFRAAERLLAPFPALFESEATLPWIRDKTIYAGFLAGPTSRPTVPDDTRIVVILGRGGRPIEVGQLAAAAEAVPASHWHVLGDVADIAAARRPSNLHLHGWVADVASCLAGAALVVGGGGDGVVAAAAGAAKRFICLPEARPYGEQREKAAALARAGAAVVHDGWPEAHAWPALVKRALALDPAIIASFVEPEAVARVAAAVDTLADEVEARERSPCRDGPR